MHKVYTDAYPTRADKRKVWRLLVLEWRSSSLTVKQFSEKNQLKEAALQRWGYRLKNQVRTNNPAHQAMTSQQTHLTPFIPVMMTTSAQTNVTSNQTPIELLINQQLVLRIPHHFDSTTLLQLIRLLREVG